MIDILKSICVYAICLDQSKEVTDYCNFVALEMQKLGIYDIDQESLVVEHFTEREIIVRMFDILDNQ